MSKIGIAKAATTVRYGPSSTLYASVGSIDAEESVVVHGMENGWYCISYSAGKLLKRGFVPSGTFTDESELSTEAIISVGYSRTVKNAQTVYTGPIPANYATAGSVSAGEVVTAFTPTEDNYTYIEYGTSSGVKRGYIPTNQLTSAKGMLAYISAATTVYYGPSTDYVISGSLTAGEYCVIISRETPFGASSKWCQVEYISGSSRKRGYVRQGNVVPYGSLSSLSGIKKVYGNAMMLSDQTVYTGPSSSYVTAGSVDLSEVVQTLGAAHESTSFTYIEYTTASGKKRGYVAASSVSEEILFPDTMSQAATVYGGPSSVIYASIGSVASGESVAVVAKENDWFAIDYIALTQMKRGYVPVSALADSNTLASGFADKTYTSGYMDMTVESQTVYSGPADSYASIGSLAADEAVTVLDTTGTFKHIEYSTPLNTKRGYIPTTALASQGRGILGTVNSNASVYLGAASSFIKSGGVYAGEYVVVLDRETTTKYDTLWYYVEFNAAAGRKRGFVAQDSVTLCGSSSRLGGLKTGDHLAYANAALTVHSGPSEAYATVGSISMSERVSVYVGRTYESDYSFIEYCTPSGVKRGYVPASQLLTTSLGIPTPSSSVSATIYGTSGTGNHNLKYYRIGSGPYALAVIFAVHGYEDAWAADGLELCKLANKLIDTLAAETGAWKSTWSVFIVPSANPDGITSGYTHNGPGRTTVSTGVDFNRCFPSNFAATYTARNYTGAQSLLAPEAKALYAVLTKLKSTFSTVRVLDIHGWLNTTYGDSALSAPFCAQFGFGNHSVMGGKGYLSRWAIASGMPAALIELPFPSAISDIDDNQYFTKINAAIHSIFDLEVDVPDSTVMYSPGSSGEEAGVLQAFLKYHGYYTNDIDEYYGKLVCSAVTRYQAANSLAATGNVDGATLYAMGFAANTAGTIHDNDSVYSDYLWKAQFYQSYEAVRDSIDSEETYYIRNISNAKQLSYTSGSASVVLSNLTGKNSQELILQKSYRGFRISSKEYPDKVLTYYPTTNAVCFADDQNASTQYWSFSAINKDAGSCALTTIEAARKYLCGVASSSTAVMETAAQLWSIRKVTYAKRLTSLMESNGVSIQYSYDSLNGDDLEADDVYKDLFLPNYPNYYLDYTTPIKTLLDSYQKFYDQYRVLPLDEYIEKQSSITGTNSSSAAAAWTTGLALSFIAFYKLVKAHAEMDLKEEDCWKNQFGDDIPYIRFMNNAAFPDEPPYKVIINGKYRTSEHIGNITYGYMGTLLGFGEELLYCAGGAAAKAGDGGILSYPNAISEAYLEGAAAYYGDGANDHYAIKEGIEWAKKSNVGISVGYELPEDMDGVAAFVKNISSLLGLT